MHHHIRIGFTADIFIADSPLSLPRGTRVLARTRRGVQVAQVLGACQSDREDGVAIEIIRPVTRQDEAMLTRLAAFKVDAVRQAQAALKRRASPAQLLDVDQLIDGGTLILHFLGDVDAIDRASVDAVVDRYESQVQSIRLSNLLDQGCGPGCGTEAAAGGGCGGACEGCAVRCGQR